jgi:hypothetical protein
MWSAVQNFIRGSPGTEGVGRWLRNIDRDSTTSQPSSSNTTSSTPTSQALPLVARHARQIRQQPPASRHHPYARNRRTIDDRDRDGRPLHNHHHGLAPAPGQQGLEELGPVEGDGLVRTGDVMDWDGEEEQRDDRQENGVRQVQPGITITHGGNSYQGSDYDDDPLSGGEGDGWPRWPSPEDPSGDDSDYALDADDARRQTRPSREPTPDVPLHAGPSQPGREEVLAWVNDSRQSDEVRLARRVVAILKLGLIACPRERHMAQEERHLLACTGNHAPLSTTTEPPGLWPRQPSEAECNDDMGLKATRDASVPASLVRANRKCFPNPKRASSMFTGKTDAHAIPPQVCLHTEHQPSAALGRCAFDVDSSITILHNLSDFRGTIRYSPIPQPTKLLERSIHLTAQIRTWNEEDGEEDHRVSRQSRPGAWC